ncbi:hypothetical protein [Sphingomonas sp. Leaf205]|uniref:hypothetical protein n=1 Tax=Sphingomonas sp. Leaf205 TaxID=2876551 RepID=UPI001E3E919D|nr:hypothetical protein [Sphingomonas sp. Leaf205]
MNDNEKTTQVQMRLEDGTLLTGQETSRRFVEALSCLLLGKPADHSAPRFGSELLLMVGPELDRDGMLWLGGIAGENMRSVVYVTVVPDMPNVPNIALAAIVGSKIHVHQRCMLTLAKGSTRARLVPQSFDEGAYRFIPSGAPQPTAAPTDMTTAVPDMTRAYVRMGKLLSRRPAGAWAPDLLSAA